MFRILSNGLAAVGLAAVIALVALMSGHAPVQRAEAAPTAVTVAIAPTVACGTSVQVSATVTNPDPNQLVTFSSTMGSVTPSQVTAVNGVATATFNAFVGNAGLATITATAGAVSGQAQTNITGVNCGNYCYNYNCGSGCVYPYNYNCGQNYNYNCSYNTYYGCTNYCGAQNYYGAPNYYGSPYSGCNNFCGAPGAYGGYYTYDSCVYPPCGNAAGYLVGCVTGYPPPASVAPARVSILPTATTVACGGATAITVSVSDSAGFKVPDGTNVAFTTTLGYISASDQTVGGTAVSSLTIPPGTSGSARVTATAGSQSADVTINVTCAVGAPVAIVQPLPPAPIPFPRPTILPPSTGDAGLASD